MGEPPSDAALAEHKPNSSAFRRRKPKREIPVTQNYVKRQLNAEAQRFRPVIVFVLNRNADKYRHLLWRPRAGLPAFTADKVGNLCKRARTPYGRLHKYLRESWLPSNAPGAPYRFPPKDVYAEVPPLKPWTPPAAGSSDEGDT